MSAVMTAPAAQQEQTIPAVNDLSREPGDPVHVQLLRIETDLRALRESLDHRHMKGESQ